jgi:hypothetical protein
MEINPYAAPQAQVLQTTSQDELIRREHLNTEASIKTVGILYYLGAMALIATGVITFDSSKIVKTGNDLLLGIFFMLLGVGMGVAAYGLRRLQSWARPLTILVSSVVTIIGLINLSWGVVIHIYIFAQMLGKRGKFVMAPEYQRIIAATPHVKRKTSVVVWVVLIVLLILLIGIIAANSFRN